MKKLLSILLFCAGQCVNAQIDTARIPFIEPSDSTGFGKHDGTPVSKQIGSAGGKIVSDDGRVELIFPTGALTTNTTISIQPTKNLAQNGVGKSYWFEPSGIQFKKAVQIIFHYTDEEAEICPPDWMSLGVQDHKGKWSFIDYESFDSVSKTLNGFIYHFSGATNINEIMISPDKDEIMVDSKTFVNMIDVTSRDASYEAGYRPGLLDRNDPVLWFVNGVLHGNNLTGKITQTTAPIGKQKVTSAEYSAPSIIPKKNPVKIWAEVYRQTRKGKKLRKRLTAFIGVHDAYEISLTHEFTSRGGLNSEMKDQASCIVWVYGEGSIPLKITDVKNYPPTVIKEGRNGPFREKIFVDGAMGTIDLRVFFKYKVTEDYPPLVYFELGSLEVLGYKAQHCGRGTGCTDIEPINFKTIPEEIEFYANGKVQKYEIGVGHLHDKVQTYKLVVTPYRVK